MTYRAEVTTVHGYLVDAGSPEQAASKAIALSNAGVRPAYTMDSTADVDVAMTSADLA